MKFCEKELIGIFFLTEKYALIFDFKAIGVVTSYDVV